MNNQDGPGALESSVNFLNKNEEVNLPEVMAGFKMLAVDIPEDQVDISESSQPTQRRSLRKRKVRNLDFTSDSTLNRRCSTRPKKRSYSEMENEEQIKEYYLDKTVKKYTNSLETIFEEKDGSSQNSSCMSVKRFKRMIQFSSEPTESKRKKRKEKVKKVFGSKIVHKRRKISMQALLDKLSGVQSNLKSGDLNL